MREVTLGRASFVWCIHAGLMNPGDEILRILGGKIIHAGVILTRLAELMNPGDEILRNPAGKIIHAGVILGRHAGVMKSGDEILRILEDHIGLE